MVSSNTHFLRSVCFGASLTLVLGLAAAAQSRGPGGMPPGPGFPGGPGPHMNPAAQHPPDSTAHRDLQKPAIAGQNMPLRSNGVQFGPVGRWWDNKSVVQSIGLTSDQKRRMDTIFTTSKPSILASYQTYLKEQSKLNSLSHNPQADQASTFAAIDAVNQARATLQKATAQMYIQIRQQMNPDQIQKLEKLE